MPEPSFIDQVSDFFNGAFNDLSKFFSEQDEDYPAVSEMSEEDFKEFSKYWKLIKFRNNISKIKVFNRNLLNQDKNFKIISSQVGKIFYG